MCLSFLPDGVLKAISHLNYNKLTEIRLRKGKPVIVCYGGEYCYLGESGVTRNRSSAVFAADIANIVQSLTLGSMYSYAEQLKRGFITYGNGVRVGIAGEYVTQGGQVHTVTEFTSLNVRIPHDVRGCAAGICESLYPDGAVSTLIYSKPGLGKTTKLRDIVRYLSESAKLNVLVFDERYEISAFDSEGGGFDLGDRTDVIRSGNKLAAVENAVRAMRPDVIVTDELYGADDISAVRYAAECGIAVIASSHITDENLLKGMPFDYFVKLESIYGQPLIYDKNFSACVGRRSRDDDRGVPFGG